MFIKKMYIIPVNCISNLITSEVFAGRYGSFDKISIMTNDVNISVNFFELTEKSKNELKKVQIVNRKKVSNEKIRYEIKGITLNMILLVILFFESLFILSSNLLRIFT
jgi:hypothetical protein